MPTMSLFTQPHQYEPVAGEIWIGLTSGSSSVSDFKYIIDVYDLNLLTNASSKLGSFKVPPRPVTGNGLFSPNKLLRSQLTYNLQPFISAVTAAPESIMKYDFLYGYSYNPGTKFQVFSASAGLTGSNVFMFGSPANSIPNGMFKQYDVINLTMDNQTVNPQYNGTVSIVNIWPFFSVDILEIDKTFVTSSVAVETGTITQVSSFGYTSSTYYAYNGTRQYDQPNSYNFDNGAGSGIILKSEPGYLVNTLSNYHQTKTIYDSQYETASIIVDDFGATWSGLTFSLTLQYVTYDKNMVPLGTFSGTFASLFPNSKYKRYDLPAGMQNLDDAGWITSWTNVVYIALRVIDTQGSNGATSLKMTKLYQIVPNCSPYTNVRIAFLNRNGGFDYWNFNWKSTNSMDLTRTEFRKTLEYNYSIGDRQDTSLAIKANDKYEIATDWISEYDSNFLKELLSSPEVYWVIENGSGNLPIIITDNNYTVKTRIKDKLFCLSINFKLAYDINIYNQ